MTDRGITADYYNGQQYIGLNHGRGYLKYANGDIYEGEFK